MKDLQRQRVYNAEHRVFNENALGIIRFKTLDDIERYVKRVTDSEIWKARGGPAKVPVRLKRPNAVKSHASSDGSISIERNQANSHIILHELAHILAGVDKGHGPEYCDCYLALIREFIGNHTADKLQATFLDHQVEIRPGKPVLSYAQAVKATKQQERPKEVNQDDLKFLSLIGYKG